MQIKYQKEAGGGTVTATSQGEHRLPDYAGDIKKILSASARVLPAGRFVGGEDVQFGGAVIYDVWYLDAENRLTHEDFSTDYEFSCPRRDGADGNALVSVSHFLIRPSGPRRISAKATLEAHVDMRAEAECSLECASGEDRLHTKQKKLSVGRMHFSFPMERECAESIAIPEAYADAEVSFCEGFVEIDSASAEQGAVILRGSYVITVVLCADGAVPLRLRESYPLDERILLEECPEEAYAVGGGYFTSLTASVKEEENPCLTFHGILELHATAGYNEQITVTEDAFIEGEGSACEKKTLLLDVLSPASSFTEKIQLTLPIEEDGQELPDSIFHTSVFLKNESQDKRDGGFVYTAEAEVCALGYRVSEDGALHYGAYKMSAPFEVALPQNISTLESDQLCVDAQPGACEGRIEDASLSLDFSLSLCVKGRAPYEVECVTAVHSLPKDDAKFVPKFTVYYPAPTDTAWSISKRFSISPESLGIDDREDVSLPDSILIDCRRNTNE